MKQLLQQEEAMVPALFSNMRKALLPLMHDDTYQVIEKVSAVLESKTGKKHRGPGESAREEGAPAAKKWKGGKDAGAATTKDR